MTRQCFFYGLAAIVLSQPAGRVSTADESLREKIVAKLTDDTSSLERFVVRYESNVLFLADAFAVRRYIGMDFLPVSRYSVYAVGGERRFHSFRGPGEVAWLLPDVKPDWESWGGREPEKTIHPSEMGKPIGQKEFRAKHPKLAEELSRSSDPQGKNNKLYVTRMKAHRANFFDGQWLRRIWGEEGRAEIIDTSKLDSDGPFFKRDFPFAVGLAIASVFQKEKSDDPPIKFALSSLGFKVIVESTDVDGIRCVLIETEEGRDRYWLAHDLGYAVKKRVQFYSDTTIPRRIWSNDKFQEDLPGIWFPRYITLDKCGGPGAPEEYRGVGLHRHEYVIDEVTCNQPVDELKELKFQTGLLVWDDRYKMKTPNGEGMVLGYVMPAEESQMDAAAKKMIAKIEQSRRRVEFRKYAQRGFIVCFIALVLGSLAYNRWQTTAAKLES